MRSYRFITKPFIWLLAFFISLNFGLSAQTSKGETYRKQIQKSVKKGATKQSNKKLDRAAKLELDGLAVPKKKKISTNAANSTATNNKLSNSNISNWSSLKKDERCSTTEAFNERLQDPRYVQYLKELKENINTNSLDRSSNIPCDASNSVVIPVAVHFDATYDCSNVQCLIDATEAQINSLNDDFSAVNADIQAYIDILASCGGTNVASDGACLTFCLANQNHPASSGLSDGQPAITIGQYSGSLATGNGAPEWQGYLNIHALGNAGASGVADGIPGALNGDGVTVTGGVFGGPNFGPCSSGAIVDDGGGAGWDLGRTLTHEVGHYLGIYHVWGDVNGGGCAGDDNISDTPDQANPSSGCTAVCGTLAACNAGEFVQYNFMDYFDDPCLVMFSNEQAIVMNNFANAVTWANDVIDTGCSDFTEPCLIDCSVEAAFTPPNGANLIVCTDDGAPIFLTDDSQLNDTWDWTFTVTGGDLTLSSLSSTMQTPDLTIEGGTSGTLEITLQACSAAGGACGGCDTQTVTYNITVASGAACPDECDYTLELTDTFGDGWNGATLDIQGNGISISGSPFGSTFVDGVSEIVTITLTDTEVITFNQTNGGFPGEEGFILTDPFGNIIFDASAGDVGAGQVFSFAAYCSPPVCDDGLQNGSEGGVDCGGTSNCPDCCNNGVQDDGETGIDCGGANCATCPSCPDGFIEIVNETFDACVLPSGWTVSSTEGATDGNGFFFNLDANGVPSGGAGPSPDFAGCIAVIDDDFADNVGIGCILTPVIDLTAFINTSLVFDWQHEAVGGGGELLVQVWDGTMWVTVFSADDDSNGTNQTVSLDVYANPNFQVQFCYDDEGGFQWGAGFDNVSLCGEANDECPTTVSATDVTGDYCGGTTIDLAATANPNLTYVWSSSSANVVIADPTAAVTTASLSTTQLCLAETVEISAVITCALDGVELFNGLVSTVNVFPNPPADPADLVNYVDCSTVSPISNCQNAITIVPEADGFTYTVTFAHTNGPNCCPDVSGSTTDIILDGDFESGVTGNGWSEFSDLPYPVIDPTFPLNGIFGLWLGGLAQGITYVQQSITISPTSVSSELFFNIAAGQCDCVGGDDMQVVIGSTVVWSFCNPLAGQVDDETTICGTTDPTVPTFVTVGPVDVSAFADGTAYTLEFNSFEAVDDGVNTSVFVDDVQLIVEEPTGEDPCTASITCNTSVPTLSQWGLISLALLLMILGSVKLAARNRAFLSFKK